MRHALLQAVWIEMCVGSVCAQPNDKNPPSVFFLILLNNFPFLKSSRSQMPVCVTSHRQAPPTIVWLTVAFQHRLDWYLTLDLPWVSCHQSAIVSPLEQM